MQPSEKSFTIEREEDYAQSANTLFHFMKREQWLKDALSRRAIIPRYCVENIEYFGISAGKTSFEETAILQKCFCDIPFHKLMHCKSFDFSVSFIKNAGLVLLFKDIEAAVERGNKERKHHLTELYADDEVEQHLSLFVDGRVFFSGYVYGEYTDIRYKRNRGKQFKISQLEAFYVLNHF